MGRVYFTADSICVPSETPEPKNCLVKVPRIVQCSDKMFINGIGFGTRTVSKAITILLDCSENGLSSRRSRFVFLLVMFWVMKCSGHAVNITTAPLMGSLLSNRSTYSHTDVHHLLVLCLGIINTSPVSVWLVRPFSFRSFVFTVKTMIYWTNW